MKKISRFIIILISLAFFVSCGYQFNNIKETQTFNNINISKTSEYPVDISFNCTYAYNQTDDQIMTSFIITSYENLQNFKDISKHRIDDVLEYDDNFFKEKSLIFCVGIAESRCWYRIPKITSVQRDKSWLYIQAENEIFEGDFINDEGGYWGGVIEFDKKDIDGVKNIEVDVKSIYASNKPIAD